MFLLSLKKLRENINHSIVFTVCIVLLSILIIMLGNVCMYIQYNIRNIVSEEAIANGLDFELRVAENVERMSDDDVAYVVDKIEEISDGFAFYAQTNSEVQINGKTIDSAPYFSYVATEYINAIHQAVDGCDYILLAQSIDGYEIGQQIDVMINGIEERLTVIGIVEGNVSYVDYSKLDIQIIYGNYLSKDLDWNKIKKFEKTIDDITKQLSEDNNHKKYVLSSSIISSYKYLNVLNIFCAGVCIFLIATVMALSIVGLINTVTINTNTNQKFFANLEVQGAGNKAIISYFFYQYLIYIFTGVAIASLVSFIIIKFSLKKILLIFFGLLGYTSDSFIIGFCWWIPFLCAGLMILVCLGVAVKETGRILKTEIATLFKEDA